MMRSFRSFLLVLFLAVSLAQAPVQNAQAQGTSPLVLTKEIEGGDTTVEVGDVIRYRIRFECSDLTTPCGEMEITDVLQLGLIYLPPPNSSVPEGFTIVEAGGTITITKDDDNLLDGSQYDAVIAVQVDYDLRPTTDPINNTITGRTNPGTGWLDAVPASAPPITVDPVAEDWGLTKTLFSPAINPTVDTDVTYQIRLCPNTNSGNVALRNITITDTLPANAVFVSATDGGDGTTVPGEVTWSVAGPVYPPNCVTRYVTIRYPHPPFDVGNNITNAASVDAQYTGSDGGTVGPVGITTNDIQHPIDPIAQVPTYSKNDTGDPVGITGTARFTLNLNTNATNYPSNQVVLIDNLPPELQVTSVTSGGWNVSFDYVRAYVEYSTNNGSSWTQFPGQPVGYNTNATYAAPAANITNVRWRFEYDMDGDGTYTAGLPYTWEFTGAPEIRVTPRATATTADPPSGAAMPAAVAGSTYTNCLQVSRVDNLGAPITDPCNNETLTVQGNFVSLQTYKSETHGASWDDLDDPNIDTFTPDSNLLPGDTLRYTLTVEVTERSSAPLVNPTIRDTLPADLVFVRNGTAQLDGVDLPPAQQPTFTQAGQVLTWAWNNPSPALTVNPLPLGSRYLTVEFFARIPRGQTPGARTDNLYVVTDSVDAICETGTQVQDSANGDVDGDGDATDPACTTTDDYIVERSAALRGEKWIRSTAAVNSVVVRYDTFAPPAVGDPACPDGGSAGLTGGGSNTFTRYPCISQAYPQGALSPGQLVPPPSDATLDDFEYNLRIFNDGNVDMLQYVLYDILPYYGDKGSGGTLANQARNSEFRPTLRGPVAFISGPAGVNAGNFTIEYNDTTNPCRPEVFNQPAGGLVPGGCNNTWTTTWSVSARSFRIRLNSGEAIPPATSSAELRFGVPMYIPTDAPPVGTFDNDDARSLEIAWNSFSHVGSYDKDPNAPVVIQDLLASEPRKVGITIPERMSVGNRVWRDSDNSGTINAPDDSNPGIPNVVVNLYRDADNNGIPDGAAIASTTTDTRGFYLFSNIPYDSADINNNRYIIGIPASNFNDSTDPLYNLRSSTGPSPTFTYINPPSTNGDSNDNGIDPAPAQEVLSANFTLEPTTEPTAESNLSSNNRDGPPGARRGVNGERDNNSDLTIDFGFFGGSDIPFSLGNHVWYDDGSGGGTLNDGIRQANEPPVAGALVRLYRDGNGNHRADAGELIRTDTTDANGFYLFDNLDPGPYFVQVAPSNFAVGGLLDGWYSSTPTGTETTGVNGGTTTADIDSDDNGVNTNTPETGGVYSGEIVLTRGVNEPTAEGHLSNNPADGPNFRGNFGETDENSNLTIDFGFIPPMSLGNRVWIDETAGTTTGYNDGIQNGTEVGVGGVRVELWRDTNSTPGLQLSGASPDTFIRYTTTDAAGYYLFQRLQPSAGNNYFVHIPDDNFGDVTGDTVPGNPLLNYISSFDANQTTAPADDAEDMDDNGVDPANPVTDGVTSPEIVMAYGTEPLTPANETDISPDTATYGIGNVGTFGQTDANSNLTMDFGFITPLYSLGNRVWYDTDNDGEIDVDLVIPANSEAGIGGVTVEVYQDTNGSGVYDAGDTPPAGVPSVTTTDATGYYRFDGLPAGDYVVVIPSGQFAVSAPLEGYWSSGTSINGSGAISDTFAPDPDLGPDGVAGGTDDDRDSDDNGATTFSGNAINYVSSAAVTLGPGTSEPTGETAPNGQGTFDNRANMTVDFGFYTVEIGDLIFLDSVVDGLYNPANDSELAGATVGLYASDNITLLDTVVTGADGLYEFTGLPQGSYIVKVTPPAGFVSTNDLGTTANPDNNTDNDDNGPGTAVGQVTSGTLIMTPGEKGPNATGVTADPTVDFGFKTVYSLGNRVWFDTNNNGLIDIDLVIPANSEVGVAGVTVEVYQDTNGSGVYDAGDTPPAGVPSVATTDANGYYRFDNLPAGNYVVVIPADNFTTGGTTDALVSYWSSGTSIDANGTISDGTSVVADDPDDDVDSDENGVTTFSGNAINYVSSAAVTLGAQAEPTSDGDHPTPDPAGEAPNNQSNRTVDFGFYHVEVGNQVFVDLLTEDGAYNAADDLSLPYATVKLFASNGINEIPVGPDGILGTPGDIAGGVTTSNSAAGNYLFGGLPEGDYIIKVTPPNGYSSTTDAHSPADTTNPNANTDNNDNGVGTGTGEVSSSPAHPVNLNPGGSAAKPNISVNNSTGTTTDLTLDFGFTVSLAKTIISTDAVHTAIPNVTIGEIITYEITMLIPVGTLNNVTVVDTPQTGLAFVDCIEIDVPVGVTSTEIPDGVCSASDGDGSDPLATNNPLIENNGGRATFDFGNIINSGTAPRLLTIRYSVIVLDIDANQNGGIRTNAVVWNSNVETKTVSAPTVRIVEPEMSIDKNATPASALLGSTITFTIDVAHAAQSTADAFDVVVTDQIPAGLTFISGSLTAAGSATLTSNDYNAATNTLTLKWDEFRLGQTARVTFQAIFVGPAPVVNSANVEWTSLLIDPLVDNTPPVPDVPVQLSPYNVNATERWYDPSAPVGVNDYQVRDSVILGLPVDESDDADNSAKTLPATGFAPGIMTNLPPMPEGFSYAQTDLWIEIQKLGLRMNIVGVPLDSDTDEWDLTWLGSDAGWLEGTAYPTHAGNSAITAHTTLSNGQDGPFAELNALSYGDRVIVHLGGQKYIYEVRENRRVRPTDVNSVLRHEEYPWLTLITCQNYNESSDSYLYRIAVRAVLVSVEVE